MKFTVNDLILFWKIFESSAHVIAGSILDIGSKGALFGAHFFEKRALFLLSPPKQMSFFTISNENILLKAQGTCQIMHLHGVTLPLTEGGHVGGDNAFVGRYLAYRK